MFNIMFSSPSEQDKEEEKDKRLLDPAPLLNIINHRITKIETIIIEDIDSTSVEMPPSLREGYWQYWLGLRSLSSRCCGFALSGQISTSTWFRKMVRTAEFGCVHGIIVIGGREVDTTISQIVFCKDNRYGDGTAIDRCLGDLQNMTTRNGAPGIDE